MRNHLSFALVASAFIASIVGCSKQNFQIQDQQQSFSQVQAYNNKVDIVILVDTSESTSDYRQKFANQVPEFLGTLDKSGMDYHIATVTTDLNVLRDGGKFLGVPKYLTPQTPNVVAELQARMVYLLKSTTPRANSEQGLESFRRALTPATLAKDAPDFIRKDALMVLIFVSDEDDVSYDEASSKLISTKAYIDFFEKLKPKFPTGARAWIAHFVGITSLNDCGGIRANPFLEVGTRYIDLVLETGGSADTICTATLADAVSKIRVQIVQLLSDYYLTKKPVVDSLRVYLNGAVVPKNDQNGWSYKSDKNMIRFNGGAIPGVFDAIKVDFTPIDAS